MSDRKASSPQGGQQKKQSNATKPHPSEWVVGAVSVLLVAAMIGFIFYQAVSGAAAVPSLTVQTLETVPSNGGFRTDFIARNTGDATAAHVEVEGQLRREGEVIETSKVTLDYVPAQSRRKGGLMFESDPRQHQLQIRAKSYRQP